MPHTPDDDQLSALLDGQAAPDAVAHVDTCPDCRDRLELLRNASRAVAAPVTPPGHIREAAVATALATAGPSGKLASLRAAARNRDRREATAARRMNGWSAAAALLVALGVGGYVLSQVNRGPSGRGQDTALRSKAADAAPTARSLFAQSGATTTLAVGTGGAAGGGAASLVQGSNQTAPTGYSAGDIGRFTNTGDVGELAQRDLAQDERTQAQHRSHAGEPYCPVPEGSALVWHATLLYGDEPAVAQVRTVTDSSWVLEVRSRERDCALLATRAFEPTHPR